MIVFRRIPFVLCWMAQLLAPRSLHAAPYELKYKVVKSFSTLVEKEGPNPLAWVINGTDGLAWDGSGIWMSECDSSVFAKVDENGKLVDKFTLPPTEMTDHLAWDGKYLWGNVHPMSTHPTMTATLIQIDTAARKVVNTISLPFGDAPTMSPMGMGFDGTYLWTNDPKNDHLYRIDPKSGEGKDAPYISSLSINGKKVHPCGVSWDGHRCLWVSDLSLGAFVQVDPKTKEVVSFVIPPDNPEPTKYGTFRPATTKKLFTGMTTDGRRVWIVDELEGNPLIYEIDVDFPKTGPCAHPAAVGESCAPGAEPYCASDAVCAGKTCRRTCTRAAGSGCPSGSACWSTTDGEVCLPDTSGGAGAACTADSGCQSGLCDAGACAEPCAAGGACPAEQSCDATGPRPVCRAAAAGGGGGGGCAFSGQARGPAAGLALLGVLLLLLRTAGAGHRRASPRSSRKRWTRVARSSPNSTTM